VSEAIVNELVEAGVHFGHRASRWNPKMAPYIYARKNGIHIIDIRETIRGLLRAKKYLAQVAAQGSLVLFVGTKKQAGPAIEREASRCKMPFVAERWLGGCLTNFRTIRSRLTRLEEVEKIRGGEQIATYSKKAQSALAREYRKMYRNLNGIRTLNRMPECLVIVDPNKEKNAVKEARARRSADSRQRRRHPLDRAADAAPGRSRVDRQSKCRRREAERQGREVRQGRARWGRSGRSEGWKRLKTPFKVPGSIFEVEPGGLRL
jgi:small subunit ribosomal protein S2